MRLLRCVVDGDPVIAVEVDGGVAPTGYTDMIDLIRDGHAGLARAREASTAGVARPERILAPLRPGKMLFCGVNYPSHAEENPNAVLPTEPFFFSKLATAIVGPGEPIRIPARDTHTDYEVELALVIGRAARRVPRERALEHVFGFTVANDVSARDVQFKDMQITLGKNPDTFCPLGPAVVTADAIEDPSNLEVACFVNGEERQRGHTKDWLFDVPALIEFVSRTMTLEPGDLITTGTPAGVAAFRDDQPWLAPGDQVVVEVEGVGRLENPVAAGWKG